MNDEYELEKIDIDRIKLYPEMSDRIMELLMLRDNDAISMYAAKLIRKYSAARCKTCKYHDEYGDCTNQKLTDSPPDNPEMEIDTDDMLIYSYNECGGFHVGDKFGCVHHAEKEEKDGI